jgi:hypothetical protein
MGEHPADPPLGVRSYPRAGAAVTAVGQQGNPAVT